MKPFELHWIRGMRKLLATRRPEPVQQAKRIVSVQLHIVLPAKVGVIAVVVYYLFYSGWFTGPFTVRWAAQEFLKEYFVAYVVCNLIATVVFALWRKFPAALFQWLVFTLGLLDGLFMAGLTFITNGFASMAYWMFPALIVLNAVSIPLAMPQVILNLLLCVFYLSAGILDAKIPYQLALLYNPKPNLTRTANAASSTHEARRTNSLLTNAVSETQTSGLESGSRSRSSRPYWQADLPAGMSDAIQTEPFVLRIFVLLLLTVCCYGVQVLAERQRRTIEEEREFAVREAQLRSAGRLAAEFAHQIKNPLAIINNAAFSLRRSLKNGKTNGADQLQIIQEEVERSDRIVTQIMGYARLSEGHVERLKLTEELDRAVEQVFPDAAGFGIRVERRYDPPFPPLLMQRGHFSEIIVNLLQNAREALNDHGTVTLTATLLPDEAIEITVADDGPGIPPDKQERVFEAYYSTKEKGTGLGLAIVKHNLELYAGRIWVESELGKGARFILFLPAKAVINLKTT